MRPARPLPGRGASIHVIETMTAHVIASAIHPFVNDGEVTGAAGE